MQKIKAYTLMEVTVAMLLSAITITICYTAYGIMTNYFKTFHDKNATADEVLTFRHVLDSDVQKSNYLLKTTKGFELLQDSTHINYLVNDDYVLRQLNELRTDTFKLKVAELKSFFEYKEIMEPDTIDQINFKLFIQKDVPITIQINKYYSAAALFN